MSQKKVITKIQTPFNHILIVQELSMREMWFKRGQDYFLQTRLDLDCLDYIPMAYPQLMFSAILLNPNPKRVLVIGLGGGHLTRMITRLYPETIVDTVEVDGEVVKLAKQYFFYKESAKCNTHVKDAREFVQSQIGKTLYDIVWLDAFKGGSVPYHLKTWQFYEEIEKILTPNGVISSNLYGRSNKLKPHDRETFRKVFRYSYGFEDFQKIATAILATNREPLWTEKDFLDSARKLTGELSRQMMRIASMYKPDLLEGEIGFVFKDDFTGSELKRVVRRNNSDGNHVCPYPIASLNPEETRD